MTMTIRLSSKFQPQKSRTVGHLQPLKSRTVGHLKRVKSRTVGHLERVKSRIVGHLENEQVSRGTMNQHHSALQSVILERCGIFQQYLVCLATMRSSTYTTTPCSTK